AGAPPPAPRPAATPRRAATAPSLLDGLDPDQRAAASAAGGPLLIVAGPGTGKTRTLTHLLAHRVRDRGVPPERCLALTFTRRAGAETRERLHALVPGSADRILVTTFHGLGLRIVREQYARLGLGPYLRVADDAVRAGLLRDVLGLGAGHARRAKTYLSEAKRGVPAGDPRREFDGLLARYDAALRERNLVDLDDLVTAPVAMLAADPELAELDRARWPQVCVDEYQDVDPVQYRLLRLLSRPDGEVCAIGDPDQAIYGFRGADVGFFLAFREDFPTARVIRLTRNYRSTPTIVRAALQEVAPVTLVPGRVLSAVGPGTPDGPVVLHCAGGEQEEAEVVADTVERMLGGASFAAIDRGEVDAGTDARLSFSDFAVLYRTDGQARPVMDALARKGLPFQKRTHDRLSARPGVRAVLRALREQAAVDRSWQPVRRRLHRAVQTVLDAMPDGGDEAAVADTRLAMELLTPLAGECGADLDRFLTELALGAEVDTWDPRADRISLLTLHAAKGLEFPVVFVVGCEDGLLPLRWSRAGSEEEARERVEEAEERRLLFVGMTRATSRLVLTYAARRTRAGTARDGAPSPFLADIDPALVERRGGRADGRARPPARAVQLRLL
ncbi:MAG TPA: ATP-dependent helicase, partial [Frankiaceae bacterium]|nr:ATP-dependent helicase [Frankiaceae bacterium]